MITMMTTKDDDKGDEQKAQRSKNNPSESKNISCESRTSQEFKKKKSRRIQDSRRKPRIKNQDSRFKISRIKNKIQDSRLKIQESREGLIKIVGSSGLGIIKKEGLN